MPVTPWEFFKKGYILELGGGAGSKSSAPTIVFFVDFVSVSVYGVGLGDIESLSIDLVINVLDIGIFYSP